MTTPARARRRSIIERIVDWMTESPDPRRTVEAKIAAAMQEAARREALR